MPGRILIIVSPCLLAFALSACGGGECAEDSDCASNERCIVAQSATGSGGVCVSPAGQNNVPTEPDMGPRDSDSDTTNDMSGVLDQGPDFDQGTPIPDMEVIDCGECPVNHACVEGECVCQPTTCAALGRVCGQVDDGCGQTLMCGTCPMDQFCSQGQCQNEPCEPATCAGLGFNCGNPSDECDGTLNCGQCTAPQTCGGAAQNFVCGCTPQSDSQLCAAQSGCGTLQVTDNCGQPRTINCGCSGGQVCHQGNCCTAQSDQAFCDGQGRTCGPASGTDNCGQPRSVTSCGSCPSGSVCQASGSCCAQQSNQAFCDARGATCGTVSGTDNCGVTRNNVSCGSCSGGQTCNANSCCTPQSNSAFCSAQGVTCGTASGTDNCGQTRTNVSCNCPSGQVCNSGTCCSPETNQQFCTRLGAACGSRSGTDNCGQPRTVSNCGSCPSDGPLVCSEHCLILGVCGDGQRPCSREVHNCVSNQCESSTQHSTQGCTVSCPDGQFCCPTGEACATASNQCPAPN